MDATKSKYWAQFVNLYRAYHETNAGLEGAMKFSDKKLKQCIYSFQMLMGIKVAVIYLGRKPK